MYDDNNDGGLREFQERGAQEQQEEEEREQEEMQKVRDREIDLANEEGREEQ